MGEKKTGEPVLETLQQSATRTGVPYTSMRKLVLEGHIPGVKLGDSRRTWVRRTDVDHLITVSMERGKR
jgi:excisionase family DNA binding protein